MTNPYSFEPRPVSESLTLQGLLLPTATLAWRVFTTRRVTPADVMAGVGIATAAYGRIRKGDLAFIRR